MKPTSSSLPLNCTAVCHLHRQIPPLSISYSSCHVSFLISCHAAQTTQLYAIFRGRSRPSASVTVHATSSFLSLAVQHKLHSCMPSSEADLDVTLTGHPLHPPRCSCLHRMWWEVAAPSSANLGHTVSKQRPAAQYTNTRWSVTSQTPGSRPHHTHTRWSVTSQTPGGQSCHTSTRWSVASHKHQVVGQVKQTPGGQSHHKHQVVSHITNTRWSVTSHIYQVVSHITNTRYSVMSHKHQVVSHTTNTR